MVCSVAIYTPINIHLFLFTVLASPDDPMLVYKYVFLTLQSWCFSFHHVTDALTDAHVHCLKVFHSPNVSCIQIVTAMFRGSNWPTLVFLALRSHFVQLKRRLR